MKISVCGKGGCGKSTLVTLLAKGAQARGLTVLVVDSDESNSGLFRMLGFEHPPIPLLELAGGKKNVQEKMKQPSLLNEMNIIESMEFMLDKMSETKTNKDFLRYMNS